MPPDCLLLCALRALLLHETSGLLHFSAASGMWMAEDTLYVVVDDALVMDVFSLPGGRPGTTLALLAGALPAAAKAREAAKPDFESLTCLPACLRKAPPWCLAGAGLGLNRAAPARRAVAL